MVKHNCIQCWRLCIACSFCCVSLPGSLLAQTELTPGNSSQLSLSSDEQKFVEQWHAVYDSTVDLIQVSRPDRDGHGNALVRQTVLTLDNQQFAGRHGRVYLWTEDGLPIVISVIMSFSDPDRPELRTVVYELNSLVPDRVRAKRKETLIWDCPSGELDWKGSLVDFPVAQTRAGRLTQMRNIARMFEAKTERNVFRLMPQPIYRYPETVPNTQDGAIFNYAVGTDPGIYLIVEARKDGWYLAPARSNVHEVEVRKESNVVWKFPSSSSQNIFQTEPFYQKYTAEKRLANDPSRLVFSAFEKVP